MGYLLLLSVGKILIQRFENNIGAQRVVEFFVCFGALSWGSFSKFYTLNSLTFRFLNAVRLLNEFSEYLLLFSGCLRRD